MRAALLLALLLDSAVTLAQQDDWEEWDDDAWEEPAEQGLEWHGFVEGAYGTRWNADPQVGRRRTLGDARARLETGWASEELAFEFKGEVWYDAVSEEIEGELRDLTLAFSPASNLDLKLGRHVLTWGTGDLLFLNDLFPKDWVSFFAGRDNEYLKAPSNAIRGTWYTDAVNVDMVWTPVFEPDNYLTGERFSFFSPLAGMRVAPHPPLDGVEPARTLDNGEFSVRLFKNVRGTEYAAYAHRGFFKQPSDFTEPLMPGFAPLSALGASVRRPLFSGLFNAEAVYYASRDDRSGTNPAVPNDQVRFLAGFEREALANFTVGFQYYVEWTLDHDALIANSPTPEFEPDEFRHVLTNRLTYRMSQDKLTLSMFTFYSPSDDDYFLRPIVSYRHSDQWAMTGGINLFGGESDRTFFGQFEDNSNVYFRVRFNF